MCRKLALTGWVLLIKEESEQARVIAALLVSIAFLSLRLTIKPLRHVEDTVLGTLAELGLILVYLLVLLIKSCNLSKDVCESFGFGSTPQGVYIFFLIFSVVLVVVLLFLGASARPLEPTLVN